MSAQLRFSLVIGVAILCAGLGSKLSWGAGAFHDELLDGALQTGYFSSLDLDAQGEPHIVYFDQGATTLWYTYRRGSVWYKEPIYGEGGRYCSLVLDAHDVPHVVFYAQPSRGLPSVSYAYRYRGTWYVEVVDSTPGRGTWCDIAVDTTNTPHLSYHDSNLGELWYATLDRGAWVKISVDATGSSGVMSAITVDIQDRPHIAHYDATALNLRRAWFDGAAWNREVVNSTRPSGLSPDIQVDYQGKVYVSHYAKPLGLPWQLMFSKRWGTWNHELVDSGINNGVGTSIVLDGFRNPHIAYSFGNPSGDLKYARHDGVSWHLLPASSSFAGADHPSLQRTNEGAVYISYQRSSSEDLALLSSEWFDATPLALELYTPTTGVAWPDADNDGHLDIYLTQSGYPNRLALGTGWGNFLEHPSVPLNGTGSNFGVAWADYDNDGDQDALITTLVGSVELVRNDGLATYTNVTAGDLLNATGTISVDWVDFDRDGALDLYLCGYTIPNMLFRNEGGDVFTDVTPPELAISNSYNASWGDLNNDGWPDVYVGVRNTGNLLFQNAGGVFIDVSSPEVAGPGSTRGGALGDYNNDGWLDIYMINDSHPNILLRNVTGFTFSDVTTAPLDNDQYGYDADWADLDNDGDVDLYLSNYLGDNRLFRNDDGSFVDATHGILGVGDGSRGTALGDMDEDGDLDIFVAHSDSGNVLLQNISSNGNHWLHLDLRGTVSNASAIGARVYLQRSAGGQMREHTGATAYISQSSSTLEFGLGADTSINLIEVLWPSGIYQQIFPTNVDTRLTVVEPSPLGDTQFRGMSFSSSSRKLKGLNFESQLQVDLSEDLGSVPDVEALTQGPSPQEAYALLNFDGYYGLGTLDPTQGVMSEVVVLEFPYTAWADAIELRGLAWDPLGGRVFTVMVIQFQQSLIYALGRIDLETGWVRNLAPLSFSGGTVGTEGLMAIAFDSNGELYAVSQLIPNELLDIWNIDRSTMIAQQWETTANEYNYCYDASFVGNEFWILTDSGEGICHRIGLSEGGDYAPERGMADFVEAPLRGLASRPCTGAEGFLTATDVPSDPGGQIDLNWGPYPPLPEIAQFEVLRAESACALLDPALAPIAVIPNAFTRDFRDSSAESYVSFHYGIRVLDGTGGTVDVLTAPPVFSFPNVLINEFAPSGGVQKGPGGSEKRVGEFVEIFNDTGAPLDLTGYRLSNGPGPPTPDEETLPSDVVPTGGYYVYILTTIDLPDAGGTLALLPPSGSAAAVDIVAYGTMGGAPTVPAGFTVSRVPGTDSTTPDDQAFEAGKSTSGEANDVPAPDLGNSLLVNEVYYEGGLGSDYVEFINPLGSTLNLDRIVISDGVAFLDTLELDGSLTPGELTLYGGGGLPWVRDLTSEQIYLYKITTSNQLQRVDQLGWTGGPVPVIPEDALQRVPDGVAEYLGDSGTNWIECGGGSTLLYGEPSPGVPNSAPGKTVVTVDPGGGADYTSIGAALAGEGPNTVILVAPATYAENINLESETEILGQVVGGSRPVIVGDGSGTPAVTASGTDATAKLASVTIQGVSGSSGPALRVLVASPAITQVVFTANVSSDDGGAVHIDGGSPVFDGCTFVNNQATQSGGAVKVVSGDPIFTRCLFALNQAGQKGGALFAQGGITSLDRCVLDRSVSSNTASGAVHGSGGNIDLLLSAVTFSSSGSALGIDGGGVINLLCGSLHGNAEPTVESANLVTADVVAGDPLYCGPAALDYSLLDASPLADHSLTSCAETIGILGPPCLNPATDTPAAQLVVNRLHRPFPNPFNPRTRLQFDLARGGAVELSLYDQRGRKVAELVRGRTLPAGSHSVVWQGRDTRGAQVASGVYFARLKLDGRAVGDPQRLVLLK